MLTQAQNIAIIGASGAIGGALAAACANKFPSAALHEFSRNSVQQIDCKDEKSIKAAAELAAEHGPIDLVINAIGLLRNKDIQPEKSLRDLSAEKMADIFFINTIAPAMIAKHFLPKLNKSAPSVFADLSARVGSISDNRLGGWYSYRASKSALNMIIKTATIETARRNPSAVVIGLHPGTVKSDLSKPFQGNVNPEKLFTPKYAAGQLLSVIENRTAHDSRNALHGMA